MLPSESFNVKNYNRQRQLSRSFSLRDDDRLFPAPDGTTNAARGLG